MQHYNLSLKLHSSCQSKWAIYSQGAKMDCCYFFCPGIMSVHGSTQTSPWGSREDFSCHSGQLFRLEGCFLDAGILPRRGLQESWAGFPQCEWFSWESLLIHESHGPHPSHSLLSLPLLAWAHIMCIHTFEQKQLFIFAFPARSVIAPLTGVSACDWAGELQCWVSLERAVNGLWDVLSIRAKKIL